MKAIKEYISENIYKQILIIFFIFLNAIIFIFQSMVVMFVLNNISKKDLNGTLLFIGLEILGVIISSVVNYTYFILRENHLENIKLSMINSLSFEIINQKNYKLKEKEKYISWLINDVDTIKNSYFRNFYIIVYDFFLIIFTASMLLWFNKYLFLFNLIGAITMFILSNKFGSKIEGVQYEISKQKEKNIKDVSNLYDNIYKFFFENKVENFATQNNVYNKNYLKNFMNLTKKFNFIICKLTILSVVIQILSGTLTAILIIQNKLTVGAFFPICTFSAYFSNNINDIVERYITFNNSKKIYEKYAKEIEKYEKEDNVENISTIEFKNISINGILKDFNLTLNKGDKCLIIGESGSGKSTIINLLLKNIQDYLGIITINSKDLKNIDKHSIYSEIEYINSENFVFYSNIYDNISIFDENCDKQSIDDIINKLELKSIEYEIEENNLSLGQKQRINLAKIFYNNKNIVILDEATSNLDEKNRKNIEKELINSDKTLILITHHYDDKYLEQFDKVIYLQNGEVKNYESK